MEQIRNPLQGITNIVRFNWHFYVIALAMIIITLWISNFFTIFGIYTYIVISLISFPILISLIVSYYIYDHSNIYNMEWINSIETKNIHTILNVHAGFDETSNILQNKFQHSQIAVLDFYDNEKHTEIAIKRARKAYPQFPGTIPITTDRIPMKDASTDLICLIFSAHEIRNNKEKTVFFNELYRILKSEGKIIITEHLKDIPNFLAYNIGFFHFYSKSDWIKLFGYTNFVVETEIKTTPFISTFILRRNGNST